MLERAIQLIPLPRSVIIILHDVAVVTAALPLAMMVRDGDVLTADRAWYVLSTLPILVAASALAAVAVGSHRSVWRYIGNAEILRVALFALTAIAFFSVGQFLIDRLTEMPRSVPAIQFLAAVFLLLGSRIAYSEYRRWSMAGGASGVAAERVLLVGSGDGAALFQKLIADEAHPDQEVVGMLCDGHERYRTIGGVPVLGKLAEFDRVLSTLRVQDMAPTRIVVTCPHHVIGRQAIYEVMERAYVQAVPVLQLPDLIRLRHQRPEASLVADAPRFLVDQAIYPGVKRAADGLVAGFVLVAFAPLLVLIATLVAATIQRPVFFPQIRPGLGRRPFKLWKFRTMRDPLDEHGRRLTDAERTPWFGALLRRTRLDELPQLWNVVNGDMALIGPRPLLAADLERMADGGAARCRIRPGITGWAQVNGGHQLTVDEKLNLDLWYAAHASFFLDAYILVRTVLMMVFGERRNPAAIAAARGVSFSRTVAAE